MGITSISVRNLSESDRGPWESLARAYKAFYNTPTSGAEFDQAWSRLHEASAVHGFGAFIDTRLVGIAHFVFHESTWATSACYLQDLFTHQDSRRTGVASALIESVASECRARRLTTFYWLTQEDNSVARSLYDKVARYKGFVRYDFVVAPPVSGD